MSVTVIDVSNVNGPVDWHAVKAAGIPAAWLKVTEGVTFNDGRYQQFRTDAKRAGVRTGGYHFARPDRNGATEEAIHFCGVLGHLSRTDLRPALDLEVPTPMRSAGWVVEWAREFNQKVKRELGVIPIFYTYSAYANSLHATTPIGNGLWLAAYGRNDGIEYPVVPPPPWAHIVAHQYTSRGTFAGHAGFVDFSHAVSLNAISAYPGERKSAHEA